MFGQFLRLGSKLTVQGALACQVHARAGSLQPALTLLSLLELSRRVVLRGFKHGVEICGERAIGEATKPV
ncbi:MAG TPA: hypothetical protein VGF76_15295 [Polyangiaceae bacterium]